MTRAKVRCSGQGVFGGPGAQQRCPKIAGLLMDPGRKLKCEVRRAA